MLRTVPEFIRELYWELEKGESGTPHVQGCFRLKTQQRLAFLQKHFLDRAHYVGLGSAEYQENMKKYAMKQDATATSGVVALRNSEPVLFPAVIPEMIVSEWLDLDIEVQKTDSEQPWLLHKNDEISFDEAYMRACRELVKRYRIETLLGRPEVKTSTRLFYYEIYERIIHNRNANDIKSSQTTSRILEGFDSPSTTSSRASQDSCCSKDSDSGEGSKDD